MTKSREKSDDKHNYIENSCLLVPIGIRGYYFRAIRVIRGRNMIDNLCQIMQNKANFKAEVSPQKLARHQCGGTEDRIGKPGNQDNRKSGCRISEDQEIRMPNNFF